MMSYPHVINALTIAEYNHVGTNCCDRPDVYQSVVCQLCRKVYEIPVQLDGEGDWMPAPRFRCKCGCEDYIVVVTYCFGCGGESL